MSMDERDTTDFDPEHIEESEDSSPVPDMETPQLLPVDEAQLLKGAAEALIFASNEPLTDSQFCAALGQRANGKLADIVGELNMDYEREGRAFEILNVAGGFQFFTRRDYSGILRKLSVERARSRLSRAALETLAVVAFRGPVTRAEIDEIRGVDTGGVLRTLLDRHLIGVRGRANVIGRPLLYETTPEFLKHFGLSELSELPRDSELTREWAAPRAIDELAPVSDQEILAIELDSESGPDHHNGRLAIHPTDETEPEKDTLS